LETHFTLQTTTIRNQNFPTIVISHPILESKETQIFVLLKEWITFSDVLLHQGPVVNPTLQTIQGKMSMVVYLLFPPSQIFHLKTTHKRLSQDIENQQQMEQLSFLYNTTNSNKKLGNYVQKDISKFLLEKQVSFKETGEQKIFMETLKRNIKRINETSTDPSDLYKEYITQMKENEKPQRPLKRKNVSAKKKN
jgi:hypothetical protein